MEINLVQIIRKGMALTIAICLILIQEDGAVFGAQAGESTAQKKLIIHIQDPHANFSGQKNLAKCLEEIFQKYGVSLVLVEGGSTNGTLAPLKKIAPPVITRRVAESLLRQGKIAGEEYLSLVSDCPMKIRGIEDMGLYRRSVQDYSDLAKKREGLLTYLAVIQRAVEKLKLKIYPFELVLYEDKTTPLVVKILELARRHDKALLRGLPNMQKLMIVQSNFQNISRVNLRSAFDEAEILEDRIYSSLLFNQDQRLLRALDKYLRLLDSGYRVQMSPDQFRLFEQNAPDFPTPAWLAFLNRKLIEQGYTEDFIPDTNLLEEGQKSLEKFYGSVDRRDLAFVANSERYLRDSSENAAVLIAGGYHTDHLKKLFQDKGYSFIVVAPSVFSETNQTQYERLLFSSLRKNTVRPPQAAEIWSVEIARLLAENAGLTVSDPQVRDALGEIEAGRAGARLAETNPWKEKFLDYCSRMNSPSHFGPAKYEGIVRNWEAIKRIVHGESIILSPTYIEIHPDEHCHNDCLYCRIRDGEGLRNVPEVERAMSLKHFKALLGDIHSTNLGAFIRLSGTIGDPLMNPHIAEMLHGLNQLGFRWGMTVNGVSLDKKGVFEESLLADYVQVSIDAGSDETYLRLKRGKKGFFERVIANLNTLVRMRNEKGSKTKIVASLLIQKENFKEIPELSRRLKEIGVDIFQIKMQHFDWRRFMTPEEVKDAYRLIHETQLYDESARYQVAAVQTLEEALGKISKGEKNTSLNPFKRCYAGMLGIAGAVSGAGVVWTCCQFGGGGTLGAFGNIREGFNSIWFGESRRLALQTKDPRRLCDECSPSDHFVNELVSFLIEADKADSAFIPWVEENFFKKMLTIPLTDQEDLDSTLDRIGRQDRENGKVPDLSHQTGTDAFTRRFEDSSIVVMLNTVRKFADTKLFRGGCPLDFENLRQGMTYALQNGRFFRSNDYLPVNGAIMDVNREHRPQIQTSEGIRHFVKLALNTKKYLVFRNQGPNAGIAVTDHDHNQLVPWDEIKKFFPGGNLPVEKADKNFMTNFGDLNIYELVEWPSRAFVMRGGTAEDIEMALAIFDEIFRSEHLDYNLVARTGPEIEFYLFPRSKVYMEIEGRNKKISSLEEIGLFVTNNDYDFAVSLASIQLGLSETSVSDEIWRRLAQKVATKKTGARLSDRSKIMDYYGVSWKFPALTSVKGMDRADITDEALGLHEANGIPVSTNAQPTAKVVLVDSFPDLPSNAFYQSLILRFSQTLAKGSQVIFISQEDGKAEEIASLARTLGVKNYGQFVAMRKEDLSKIDLPTSYLLADAYLNQAKALYGENQKYFRLQSPEEKDLIGIYALTPIGALMDLVSLEDWEHAAQIYSQMVGRNVNANEFQALRGVFLIPFVSRLAARLVAQVYMAERAIRIAM